jgi:hypothetical protein
MPEIRFKGKKVRTPEIGEIWIPTAEIELITDKKNYFCEMIVDSGADITLVPRSLGEFLGFSFAKEKIREIRVIGEQAIPYIIRSINIKIGKYLFKSRIGIALIEEIPLILGRLDVFDHFDIELKQNSKVTVFKRTVT